MRVASCDFMPYHCTNIHQKREEESQEAITFEF